MKVLPKFQNPASGLPNDNTRVVRQPIQYKIKYTLKPGEFFWTNRDGSKTIIRGKNAQVSKDTRSESQRKQDQAKAPAERKRRELKDAEAKTAIVAGEVLNRAMPSTIARAAYDATTGKKSFAGSMIEGNAGLGDPALNFAFDALAPIGVAKGFKYATNVVPKVARFGVSNHTGNWTQFGNSMYRLKPGYAGMNGVGIEKAPVAPNGWEIIRPLTLNGQQTWQVKHPRWGFTTLEEANGTVGRGQWAREVTNDALDNYNPAIRKNPDNNELIDEMRYIARRIDQGKDTPAVISNTEGYEYPKIMDLLLKTQLGQKEYPHGATMVFRGLWPGSSTIAKSPNYDALFLGYNRDMAMPYMRIGSNLGGKNNFGPAQYEKYFNNETVQKLRSLDDQINELITTKGYYDQGDAVQLQHLHNLRSTILGDKMPEFGGLQQLLVPNSKDGEMLNITYPRGLALEGSKFGDLGAGQPITIPNLAGDTFFYDANAVSGALASEGPARGYYGVFLHSKHPGFTGIHDKGIGSTLIWNQDGFAPFLKSVHGNSFRNLSGSIESAYKKGGKIKI